MPEVPVDERDLADSPSAGLPVARHALLGDSDCFRQVLDRIRRLSASDATVLITGETGTGKELAASAIHVSSRRAGGSFIPVNCGALPDDLVENELFGHARGAYTGAATSGRGLLAEAEGGTLFLDELNSLSRSAQAKLLRFLQSREYRVLGSTRLIHADVRIIAATNLDLRREIAQGRFRADLFHRLHVLSLDMPSLRQRRADIPLLARHFVEEYARLYGRGAVELSADAIASLAGWDWPGNVRELQSVLERAVLLSSGATIEAADLGMEQGGAACPADPAEAGQAGPEDADSTFRGSKERAIRLFERDYLAWVMAEAGGNVSSAARRAGMQRRDFQRLLRKHDIRRADRARQGGQRPTS